MLKYVVGPTPTSEKIGTFQCVPGADLTLGHTYAMVDKTITAWNVHIENLRFAALMNIFLFKRNTARLGVLIVRHCTLPEDSCKSVSCVKNTRKVERQRANSC